MQHELKPITDATQGTGSLVGPHQPPRELAVPATGADRRIVPPPPATLTVTDGTTSPVTPPPSSSSRTIDVTSGGPADQHPTREAPVAPTASTDPSHDPVQRRGTEASSSAEPPALPDAPGVKRRDLPPPPPPPPPVPPPTAFPGPEEPERPRTARDLTGEPTTDTTDPLPREATATTMARIRAAEEERLAGPRESIDELVAHFPPRRELRWYEDNRPEQFDAVDPLLTTDQRKVLTLVRAGFTSFGIAEETRRSTHAVNSIRKEIIGKIHDGVPTDTLGSHVTFPAPDGRAIPLASTYLRPEGDRPELAHKVTVAWIDAVSNAYGSLFTHPYETLTAFAEHVDKRIAHFVQEILTAGIGDADPAVDHQSRLAFLLANAAEFKTFLDKYNNTGVLSRNDMDGLAAGAFAGAYEQAPDIIQLKEGEYYTDRLGRVIRQSLASYAANHPVSRDILAMHYATVVEAVYPLTAGSPDGKLHPTVIDGLVQELAPHMPSQISANALKLHLLNAYGRKPSASERARAERALAEKEELAARQEKIKRAARLTRIRQDIASALPSLKLLYFRAYCVKYFLREVLTDGTLRDQLQLPQDFVDQLPTLLPYLSKAKHEGSQPLSDMEVGKIVGLSGERIRQLRTPVETLFEAAPFDYGATTPSQPRALERLRSRWGALPDDQRTDILRQLTDQQFIVLVLTLEGYTASAIERVTPVRNAAEVLHTITTTKLPPEE